MDTLAKYRKYLGREVDVVIDRQIGMKHPKFETVYQCNYGYVADTVAGDGKEIDAYVLGLEEPAEKYNGKCTAIIFFANDVEQKLVVSDAPLPIDEIHLRTNFIERYFEIRMEVFDV